MIFSELISDLQDALKKDLAQIRFLLKKNPAMGYTRIVDIGKEVGKKYNIKLDYEDLPSLLDTACKINKREKNKRKKDSVADVFSRKKFKNLRIATQLKFIIKADFKVCQCQILNLLFHSCKFIKNVKACSIF